MCADSRGKIQGGDSETCLANLMYIRKNQPIIKASFDQHQVVYGVVDEGRFGAEWMGGMLCMPLQEDGCAFGFVPPPQEMPELHADFEAVSADARITTALSANYTPSATAKPPQPKAEHLAATFECIGSVHNMLLSVDAEGLKVFEAAVRPLPLTPGQEYVLHQGVIYVRSGTGLETTVTPYLSGNSNRDLI